MFLINFSSKFINFPGKLIFNENENYMYDDNLVMILNVFVHSFLFDLQRRGMWEYVYTF